MPTSSLRVLFLGTGNSARSILAEYLIRKVGKGKFESFSAGMDPVSGINPYVLRILKDLYKVDASEARPKSLNEFKDVIFDFVITSSDDAKARCPAFPGYPIVTHWSTPDPETFSGSERDTYNYFWRVSQLIYRRIDLLCNLSFEKLDRLRLEQAAGKIGTEEKMTDDR